MLITLSPPTHPSLPVDVCSAQENWRVLISNHNQSESVEPFLFNNVDVLSVSSNTFQKVFLQCLAKSVVRIKIVFLK